MNEKIKETIIRVKDESKKCQSIEDYLELAYSFRYEDLSFVPLQIKNEVYCLLKVLSENQPQTLLEIGTANGGTLFLLSKIATDNANIISIDLPDGQFGGEYFPNWKQPLYESFASENQKIHLIRANSHDEDTFAKVKTLVGEKKIDFLFIDGDHTYEGVKKDFEMYKSLLANEGIIVFHDICKGNTKDVNVHKFWNEIKSKYLSAEIIDSDGTYHYGIGLIVNSIQKGESKKYIEILKTILEVKNAQSIRDNKEFFETFDPFKGKKVPLAQKDLNQIKKTIYFRVGSKLFRFKRKFYPRK